MQIFRGYENIKITNPVVALGIFDGVHRGHKLLLKQTISVAKKVEGESVVMTFSPHPRLVLEPDNNRLSFLTTIDEKSELLERYGVDNLVIVDFTREFSRISAYDFMKTVLKERIHTKCLIIGYDNHFGSRGEGNATSVENYSMETGIAVERVGSLLDSGIPISSSVIRTLLLKGDIEHANELLGYEYTMEGVVEKGFNIGHKIGFPTANIGLPDAHKLIPSDGVYAVRVKVGDDNLIGMLSIGNNPTVQLTTKRTIEVHIFDFDKDIYGKNISIKFVGRLRDLNKFPDVNTLSHQMSLDSQVARSLLVDNVLHG